MAELLSAVHIISGPRSEPPIPMLTDVGDDLVGIAQPAAAADFVCKFAHALEDVVDFGHDVFAVNDDGGVGAVAQGDVEDGAVFGGVDFFATEHLLHAFGYAGFTGKLEQQCHGFVVDAVFGISKVRPPTCSQ